MQEGRSLPDRIQSVKWRSDQNRINWLDYWKLKKQFHSAIAHVQPDIVHAGPIQRVALLPVLCSLKPLISMSWGFDLLEDAERDMIWKSISKFVLKRTDWLLVDCQAVRKQAIKLGAHPDCITVFPWGVDLDVFRPAKNTYLQRAALGYKDEVVFIHTRSWEPRYGVDIMLKGFAVAAREAPNIRLLMLGGGSQEDWIKYFIKGQGLQDRVNFIGYQQNVFLVKYYQAADVYLSASHIDGTSIALLESMACGCPALVSNIPSNLEWISDGVQGWVFRDGDPNDLAQKMILIAQNKEKCITAGKNAREKALKDADWRGHSKTLLDVYEHVVNNFRQNQVVKLDD